MLKEWDRERHPKIMTEVAFWRKKNNRYHFIALHKSEKGSWNDEQGKPFSVATPIQTRLFSTKVQAIRFAKNYMRKH